MNHLTPFLRWAEDKPTSPIFPVDNSFSTDRSFSSVEDVFDGRELMHAPSPSQLRNSLLDSAASVVDFGGSAKSFAAMGALQLLGAVRAIA